MVPGRWAHRLMPRRRPPATCRQRAGALPDLPGCSVCINLGFRQARHVSGSRRLAPAEIRFQTRFFEGPVAAPLTKDAHEVQQIEPAFAGCRGQPAGGYAGHCLLPAHQTLTVDFVYVASAKAAGADNYGEINVFEINSESGRMRQIPTSPFPSAGRNPVAEAVSVR